MAALGPAKVATPRSPGDGGLTVAAAAGREGSEFEGPGQNGRASGSENPAKTGKRKGRQGRSLSRLWQS